MGKDAIMKRICIIILALGITFLSFTTEAEAEQGLLETRGIFGWGNGERGCTDDQWKGCQGHHCNKCVNGICKRCKDHPAPVLAPEGKPPAPILTPGGNK